MTLILSHIGKSLPNHLFDCINQTRKFYNGKIVLVTDSENTESLIEYDVEIIKPDFGNEKFKIAQTINFYHYPSREFWLYSLVRFFFIEDYVVENKVKDFIIYENDILIYSDLEDICDKLSKIYKNIAITISDDRRATTGFSYFKSYEDLVRMNDDILTISQDTNEMSDILTNYAPDCPSEMVFIRKIAREKNYIVALPSLTDDKFYDKINFVFDPASYGQFLGGTPPVSGNHKNYVDDATYIGKKILNNEISVHFDKVNGPYVIEEKDTKKKIFNLHIHSKNLSSFM